MSTTTNGQAPQSPRLLAQHLDDLRRSGLSDEQIAACGFCSLDDPTRIDRLLGRKVSKKGVTCGLAIPFPGPDGKPNGYGRLKPDRPRPSDKDGSPVRYESPSGKPNRAYLPPGTLAVLADPSKPLVITEGEKKAAKADQEGFPCIGLVGVYGWQKKCKKKDAPRELIPDLEGVAWKGRAVFVCYDSDLAEKTEVAWAEWRLAEALAAKGAAVKVTRLPSGPEGAKVGLDDYLIAHGPDDFRLVLEHAQPPTKPKDGRPEIVLGPLEFLCIEEGIKALAKGDKTLYQRGGQLVRVVRPCLPVESRKPRGSGGPQIETLPTADLRTRLTRNARIIKTVQPQKKDATPEKVPCHPPAWLVQGVGAVGRWPGVPPLEAVVTSPVLLPDGTVLQRPGYDAKSGLFYEANDDYQPIPERPTRTDVEKARDALLEIVADFPFARPEHRAAYVASVLTPLARFAFDGPAPLFLIDGNVRGTGKDLLADTAARVSTGRNFARAAYAPDPVEMKKVITAIALSGEQLVLLDNIGGVLGDSSLDAALTATDWQERVLGVSQRPRLPLIVTWYATGNNVVLLADTARRVCHIRLNSLDERPEERSDFHHRDLLAWVAQERGRLLTAALTILSGYCLAGRPDQMLKPWGSFEGWTALVRQAVVWAGLPDPGLTRQMLAEGTDREAGALRGMIAGWKEIDPERQGKTVAEVLALLDDKANASLYPVLRGVLAEVFDLVTGKLPSSRKLGQLLRKFVGRNAGGECFDSREGHGGVKVWAVRDMGGRGNDPEGGDCGGFGGFGGSFSTHNAGARF